MTPHQIIAVCLRLLAVILAFYILSRLYGTIMFMKSDMGDFTGVFWVLTIGQFLLLLFLWFFPMTLAKKLLSSSAVASEPVTRSGMLEWQTLGVICIGLWAMFNAISDVAYWASYWNMAVNTGLRFEDFSTEQKAGVIVTAVELVLSAWLLLGAKGFAAFLYKVRTAGVAKSS